MEKLTSFSIIAFILSFGLGLFCLFYVGKILINKRITIKVMEESLGTHAEDKSIIAMICLILGLFSACFFSVCIGIYFFAAS